MIGRDATRLLLARSAFPARAADPARAIARLIFDIVPLDRLIVDSDAYPASANEPETSPVAVAAVIDTIAAAVA
jgi:hypothetical protein